MTLFQGIIDVLYCFRQFAESTIFAKKIRMENLVKNCFVCEKPVNSENSSLNLVVNMRVCNQCKNSQNEKLKEAELLESLADGFVCGCI